MERPPHEWSAWRAKRLGEVGGAHGWSTLVGLHWLAPGRHGIGASATADVRLPEGSAPPLVGILIVGDDAVDLSHGHGLMEEGHSAPTNDIMRLSPDVPGPPTLMRSGRLTWWIIRRGNRLAVRVRDPEAPARRSFHGIPAYPYDPAYRIEARFIPSEGPRTLAVTDVTGNTSNETVPGTLVFELDGTESRLIPVEDRDAGDWFINFKDSTSGHGTYPGGRFLHVRKAGPDGKVVLDFNFAYNPPCAFTAHATCPMPPRANHMGRPIRAGERFLGH